MPNIIDTALAYAAELDARLAATTDDAEEAALMAVGDLCGGLSVKGFLADLQAHIERASDGEAVEPEYAPYAGGWVRTGAAWLSAAGERAQEDAAAEWLEAARVVRSMLGPDLLAELKFRGEVGVAA